MWKLFARVKHSSLLRGSVNYTAKIFTAMSTDLKNWQNLVRKIVENVLKHFCTLASAINILQLSFDDHNE
jgi:hypothetical protein